MKTALRIALISEHASPLSVLGGVDAGGQNIYVAQVARCLAEAGHQVDVFTRREQIGVPSIVPMRSGVRVVHVNAGPPVPIPKEALLPYMPAFAKGIEDFMAKSGGFDIAHAHFFMSGLVAQHLKDRHGLPYVLTFHALGRVRREHQGLADGFPNERIDIEQMLVNQADRIVAECPQDREDLMRLYDADASKLCMVPCGCDVEEFKPMNRHRARDQISLKDDEFVILQLGRMVPRKGIDNVIRALSRLQKDVHARLLIVGGDSRNPAEMQSHECVRLKEVAQECGVSDKVVFIGHRRRDELRRYYAAANVFVTTPWYEPFGITPLEAMACGTPVIASAVGGLKYSVTDGVTGLLVPPHAPDVLAQSLSQLHANPGLAQAMGRAGIRKVRSLFTWERVTSALVRAYQEVLSTPYSAEGMRVRASSASTVAAALN